MSHVIGPILFSDPFQHCTATIVVKVNVNIRHGNTIRIQKTFKQQVILNRINIGNRKRIGHCTARSRTTSRTDNHPQLTGRSNVILHNQEITGETHLLDRFQLEGQPLLDFIGHCRTRPTLFCALPCQMCQEITLQFDAQHLVIAPELIITIKLISQRRLVPSLCIRGFCSKAFRNRKLRHNRRRIQLVDFHLFSNFHRIVNLFTMIRQCFAHLFVTFEPFLLRVPQTLFVRQFLPGADTEQDVMRRTILSIQKVNVIGRNHLNTEFSTQCQKRGIHFQLALI